MNQVVLFAQDRGQIQSAHYPSQSLHGIRSFSSATWTAISCRRASRVSIPHGIRRSHEDVPPRPKRCGDVSIPSWNQVVLFPCPCTVSPMAKLSQSLLDSVVLILGAACSSSTATWSVSILHGISSFLSGHHQGKLAWADAETQSLMNQGRYHKGALDGIKT
jgi:hypothetical protein